MFVALEQLINLQDGYRRTFQVAGRQQLLLVVEQQPVLRDYHCPHRDAPLKYAVRRFAALAMGLSRRPNGY